MISVVYVLGNGSRLKNFELRISLRSIEKYLSGIKDVWIVGEFPSWLQDVNHIPAADEHRVPDRNIMEKISLACRHPEITDDFIFFNDDHYLLTNFDTATFPYFHRNNLDEYVRKRGLDSYGRRARNTWRWLESQSLPFKHFDVHTPIIYNKEQFLKSVTAADWKGHEDGFIIKSLYANSLKIEGEKYEDNKVSRPPLPGERIFSTTPHLKASVTRALKELFPKKSRFERVDF